jgi:hypothetical protein
MKTVLFLATLIFLLDSCGNSKPKTDQKKRIENNIKIGAYDKLLAKYKDISFDTLKVFSSTDLDSKQYKFAGTQLDRNDVLLFPENIAEQYLNDPGYFACYKFPIDDFRIGLITRTPSTYEPSSIKLLIFDKQANTILDMFELAEIFGDAGDAAEKVSWLFKDEKKKYKSFTWLTESHDNSVDDERDTTVESWNYYCLIDMSKRKVDTISRNEKELLTKFGYLIGK